MNTIWSIVGIVVLLILLYAIFSKAQNRNNIATNPPIQIVAPPKNISENVIQREVIVERPQPVIIIGSNIDCTSNAYKTNVYNLYNTYLEKRSLWQQAISTGSGVIAAAAIMNTAYNAWYNERAKCVLVY